MAQNRALPKGSFGLRAAQAARVEVRAVQQHPVVIAGAGPAGLSTAGALRTLGITPLVLDRESEIGASWLRRYDRLHLHTIRRFSGLAQFPIPRTYPKYLSRDQYAEYLRTYARHFGIDVVHGCSVDAVASAAGPGSSGLLLKTSTGDIRAGAVVVATGMFARPFVPGIAKAAAYGGAAMHASSYKNGTAFAGKRVLVTGLGNTGAEIAADLVEHGASSVAVSVRTMPPIVPRDFLGTPVQAFGIALSRVPARTADRIGAAVSRVALGDLTRYGLRRPQWQPFTARRIPVIDAGFVKFVKQRNIEIRPPVASFAQGAVTFANGETENFDALIYATGYETGLHDIVNVPETLDEHGMPLSGRGEPTALPGLYFMGFLHSHRGHLFEIEHDSMRLARRLAGVAVI